LGISYYAIFGRSILDLGYKGPHAEIQVRANIHNRCQRCRGFTPGPSFAKWLAVSLGSPLVRLAQAHHYGDAPGIESPTALS
jgi:hypothetical protein